MKDDFFMNYFILIDLDGIMLFYYVENSVKIFFLDVDILIGIVKKILVFMDKGRWFEEIDNDLLNKMLKEIVEFV